LCEEGTSISLPTCLLENTVREHTCPALNHRKGEEGARLGFGNVIHIWFTKCHVCGLGTVSAAKGYSGEKYCSTVKVPPRAGCATSNPEALVTLLLRLAWLLCSCSSHRAVPSGGRTSCLLLRLPLLFESILWRSQVSTHHHVTLPLSDCHRLNLHVLIIPIFILC